MDDLDRLFRKLEPIDPPADFGRRVASLTHARPAAGRRALWLWLDVAALLLLALVSTSVGMELHESGALDLIGLMALEFAAMQIDPGLIGEAVLATLPWLQIGVLAINVAAVAALSRLALEGPATARGVA